MSKVAGGPATDQHQTSNAQHGVYHTWAWAPPNLLGEAKSPERERAGRELGM